MISFILLADLLKQSIILDVVYQLFVELFAIINYQMCMIFLLPHFVVLNIRAT